MPYHLGFSSDAGTVPMGGHTLPLTSPAQAAAAHPCRSEGRQSRPARLRRWGPLPAAGTWEELAVPGQLGHPTGVQKPEFLICLLADLLCETA